jgi:hypothetical protein
VREAIAQYIGLIKQITHQTISDHMSQEIIKAALANPESLHAFFSLTGACHEIRKAIINKMYEQLDTIARQLELELDKPPADLAPKYAQFTFTLRNPKFLGVKCKIAFGFDRDNYRDFSLGYCDDGQLGSAEERNRLKNIFEKQFGKAEQSPSWPAYVYFGSSYRNWSEDVFEKINSGVFTDDVKVELQKLIKIAEEFVSTQPAQST